MTNSTDGYGESVRQSIDAFNRGNAAEYAAHYDQDARLIGPFFQEPLLGRESIEQTTIAVSSAFPDMKWSIVTLLEDEDRVACELHIEGTHDGPLATPEGDLPATGRKVSFDVFEILEFTVDGLVAEHREYMDTATFMAQLGLSGE